MGINNLLIKVGLNDKYICHSPNFHFWDDNEFKYYNTNEYLNSERREVDEFYNLHESVLLHQNTGLRITMLASKDYTGEIVEYSFCKPFILNQKDERVEVDDVDIQKKIFIAGQKEIPFNEVKKN